MNHDLEIQWLAFGLVLGRGEDQGLLQWLYKIPGAEEAFRRAVKGDLSILWTVLRSAGVAKEGDELPTEAIARVATLAGKTHAARKAADRLSWAAKIGPELFEKELEAYHGGPCEADRGANGGGHQGR